jgi:hypothetical protein
MLASTLATYKHTHTLVLSSPAVAKRAYPPSPPTHFSTSDLIYIHRQTHVLNLGLSYGMAFLTDPPRHTYCTHTHHPTSDLAIFILCTKVLLPGSVMMIFVPFRPPNFHTHTHKHTQRGSGRGLPVVFVGVQDAASSPDTQIHTHTHTHPSSALSILNDRRTCR